MEHFEEFVQEDAFGIKGLWYLPRFLTQSQVKSVKDLIQNDIELESISKSPNSRKVAHFGYYYAYDRSGLKPAKKIPNLLRKIANKDKLNVITMNDHFLESDFNQVIINQYHPGQQISPHIDHTKLFGPTIFCITIGQPVPIKFQKGNDVITIEPCEGSAYIMTGDARYAYKHSLKNNGDDTRYSITYRTVNS